MGGCWMLAGNTIDGGVGFVLALPVFARPFLLSRRPFTYTSQPDLSTADGERSSLLTSF